MTDQFIYIDNEKVHFSELNEEEKYLVSQINDINNKLAQLQFSADQLNASKGAFSAKLIASRKKEEQEVKEPALV
jgi:F0F1-type ATP synthase beta subunit